MNINCTICSDLIEPTADVYSTTCGHIFHYTCLIQWIERSKTCPQCRNKATEKTIHRVYFNLQNASFITEDLVTLQAKCDNFQFQLNLKEKDLKAANTKIAQGKGREEILRNDLRESEQKRRSSEETLFTLRQQLEYYKLKIKDNDKLNEEVLKLKNRIENMISLQTLMQGTKDDVDQMMRVHHSTEALTLFVCSLKKQLVESDKTNKTLTRKMHQLANDILESKSTVDRLQLENVKLLSQLDSYEDCERERKYLKRKLKEITENKDEGLSTPDNVLMKRMIHSSPAPAQPDLNVAIAEICDSPTVNDLIKETEESDSPYLKIKSTSVGLSGLLNAKFTVGPKYVKPATSSRLEKLSLVKTTGNFNGIDKMSADYCYNGLGDRSKVDIFPQPLQQVPPFKIGLKRSSSAATISSTKFRKLSSQNVRK